MDLDEIENKYTTDVARANESFIKGLQKKNNKAALETDYKLKLKSIADAYQKNIQAYLKKQSVRKRNLSITNPKKASIINQFGIK